ncbi:hypothetical protein GCM10027089_52620 [Nocardia thraciensis]
MAAAGNSAAAIPGRAPKAASANTVARTDGHRADTAENCSTGAPYPAAYRPDRAAATNREQPFSMKKATQVFPSRKTGAAIAQHVCPEFVCFSDN